ncbi:MAG TPA: molybdopterin converting factor, small subunit [Cycloclasticus sp.]|jgi:molybdopterin converting factor small subunit|nr:molybdopterin converting factor, small subunit [Cycloclasticus sp.]HIL91866.1 molybdopterin converting factor, small subunit [Cycloclasticus sp.]
MSEVTVKLFASLAKVAPENIGGEIKTFPLDPGDTIPDIVSKAKLGHRNLHLIVLNGTYIDKDKRASTVLSDGDVLAFWPPVIGG